MSKDKNGNPPDGGHDDGEDEVCEECQAEQQMLHSMYEEVDGSVNNIIGMYKDEDQAVVLDMLTSVLLNTSVMLAQSAGISISDYMHSVGIAMEVAIDHSQHSDEDEPEPDAPIKIKKPDLKLVH